MNSLIPQSPAKCPRPECIRSKPWFEDGNIVLETQRVQFKVYKGILAANSAIFRDLFTNAQAQEGELVDGCPVVHLSDNPQDLEHVLEALHDSRKWHEDNDFEGKKPMPLAVVEAFLRIGRKYEFDHIRKQAVQRLAVAFPTDLNTCHGMFATDRTPPIPLFPENILALVNVLRENDLLVHLPISLFRCIFVDHYTLVPLTTLARGTQHSILSYKDIHLCHKAHMKLMQLQATVVFSWMQPWEARRACNNNRCKMQRAVDHQGWFGSSDLHSFNGPMVYIFADWQTEWSEGLCEGCNTHARQMFAEGQEKVFEMLPSIFDLPGWDELRDKWSTVCRSRGGCSIP